MTTPRDPAACVFCGRPIAGDEPVAGRPPMAAHAACADAALADDRHWDAVAGPEVDATGEAPTDGARRRGMGCLSVLAVAAGPLAMGLFAATFR
jgi:hypothetical protein